MAEGGSSLSPESRFALPGHFGAMLEGGRNTGQAIDRYTLRSFVDIYKVNNPIGRRDWMFKNVNAFSKVGFLESQRWRVTVIEDWIHDLDDAAKFVNRRKAFVDKPIENLKTRLARVGKTLQAEAETDIANSMNISPEDRMGLSSKDKEDTEKKLKAFMAVSASARAMEFSTGDPGAYVNYMTSGALGNAGTWRDYLIHGDEEKLALVVNDPLVRSYYIRLLQEAGYEVPQEIQDKTDLTYEDIQKIKHRSTILLEKSMAPGISQAEADALRQEAKDKIEDTRAGVIARYLKKGGGGFDKYISEVLLKYDLKYGGSEDNINRVDDEVREAAAKLACDTFLIDKFTKWEFDITGKEGNEKAIFGERLELYPSGNWDGDPFRPIIEPPFLPQKIKGVYYKPERPKEGQEKGILDLAYYAFRPTDAFIGIEDKMLQATATCRLKEYARLCEAMGLFFGGSTADGIASWSDETMVKSLPEMTKLLFQVYGNVSIKMEKLEDANKFKSNTRLYNALIEKFSKAKPNSKGKMEVELRIGRDIVGLMLARIIECKVLAYVAKSSDPSIFEHLEHIIGDSEKRKKPEQISTFLFGQGGNFKSGFCYESAEEQYQIVFNNNLFGAMESLGEARAALASNSQDPETRKRAATIIIAKALANITKSGGKAAGVLR